MPIWKTLFSVLLAASLSFIIGLMASFLLASDWRIKPLRDMYERLDEKIRGKENMRFIKYHFPQVLLKLTTGNVQTDQKKSKHILLIWKQPVARYSKQESALFFGDSI